MVEESRTTSFDLFLDLSSRHETTRGARLQGALRDAVRNGALGAGARLPSSRALAADLGVSRGMVVEAFEQLTAEGYLVSQPGSGTSVSPNVTIEPEEPIESEPDHQWRIDFAPGTPDLGSFPTSAWTRAHKSALDSLTTADLGYGDPFGDGFLRGELASYLGRVRGARVDPGQVAITAGFTSGLGSLSRTFLDLGRPRVAVEDPGAYVQRAAIAHSGLDVVPIDVDDQGLVTDQLTNEDAILVTPAHQYPLGIALSPDRRAALVAWADRNGGLIIEDDYDAEFRYDRQPVGVLQGLAPDRVVLGGSVSKALAPGVGLGWIVVPPALVPGVRTRLGHEGSPPSLLLQRTFAKLIEAGSYDRHIRRMRSVYRSKRDALVSILDGIPGATIGGIEAGLHLVVTLEGHDVEAIREELRAQHINVAPLTDYEMHRRRSGFVLGYAHLSTRAITDGARAIRGSVERL